MARTTFSGPVNSGAGFEGDIAGDVTGNLTGNVTGNVTGAVTATALTLPTATAAELGDEDDAINTTGKVAGKAVVDLTDGLIYVATGDDVNDKWVASDGTTDITPA
jgi:hypothetical protein